MEERERSVSQRPSSPDRRGAHGFPRPRSPGGVSSEAFTGPVSRRSQQQSQRTLNFLVKHARNSTRSGWEILRLPFSSCVPNLSRGGGRAIGRAPRNVVVTEGSQECKRRPMSPAAADPTTQGGDPSLPWTGCLSLLSRLWPDPSHQGTSLCRTNVHESPRGKSTSRVNGRASDPTRVPTDTQGQEHEGLRPPPLLLVSTPTSLLVK